MPISPAQGPFDYTETFSITVSDTVQSLGDDYADSVQKIPSGGSRETALYALIQARDEGILWAIGVDPVQDGLGYEAPAGSVIVLYGEDAIFNFRFLNLTNGEDARLIVTVGF